MADIIQEVLPKAGLVYSEKGNLSEVLCKPKIMPIKSVTLERLEQLEKEAALTAAAEGNNGEEESKRGEKDLEWSCENVLMPVHTTTTTTNQRTIIMPSRMSQYHM